MTLWMGGGSTRFLAAVVCAGLSLCAVCGQPAPGAKISFTDLRGRVFKDAQVIRLEPDALVLMTGEGISRVPAAALPEDIRKQFDVKEDPPAPGDPMAPPPEPEPEMPPAPSRFDVMVAEVEGRIAAGDAQAGLLRIQELGTDRSLRGGTNPEGLVRVVDLALKACNSARQSGQPDVASAALRVAVELDQHSPQVAGWLTRFFREVRPAAASGDFAGVETHLHLLEGVGLDDHELYRFQMREMANHCLDGGTESLRSWDLPGACRAVSAARRIWERNPRLAWLRNLVITAIVLGLPVAIFAVYRLSERIYWWIVD